MSTEQNTIATMVRAFAEIIERQVLRFENQGAEYERKLAEHRASFGARTEADRKIIEGLRADLAKEREEHQEDVGHLNGEIVRFHGIADDLCNRLNSLGIKAAKQAGEALGMVEGEGLLCAAKRVVKERDGLLTQVQDMRAEIERLQWENKTMQKDAEDGYAEAINVLGDPIALSKERDALRAEVADLRGVFDMVHASLGIKRGDHIGNAIAALKTQTPKRSHPVKAGEWVKNSDGGIAQVLEVRKDWYLDGWWTFANCEPCDTPADHDTPAGKEAAEAASKVPQ